MTSTLLTAALLVALGVPIAFALPARSRSWHGLIAEAYLLGAGAATFVLFALSLAGIAWSRTSFGAGCSLVALIAVLVAIRGRREPFLGVPRSSSGSSAAVPPRNSEEPSEELRGTRLGLANLVDVVTAALMGGHFLLATTAPPVESDYLLIWGVKARMFLAAAGIDWSYLEAPLNIPAHTDYPLLLPLLYDVYAIVHGSWPEAWAGFPTFAFGLAGLLALRSLLPAEMPKLARAVATLILMPVVFSPYIGLAEAPLIAYATIGVLYVKRGVAQASRGEIVTGAVFLGLAAWSKNEGLSLIGAVAVGMIVARRFRLLPWLFPAVAINVPWLILHRLHGLKVDLAAGGAVERLAARLSEPLPIVEALLPRTGMPPLFWAGVAVAVAIGIRRMTADDRFLAVATAIQLLIYAGVYFMTPRDLMWHIHTSWARVLRQIMPLIVLTAILPAFRVIRFRPENTNATDP